MARNPGLDRRTVPLQNRLGVRRRRRKPKFRNRTGGKLAVKEDAKKLCTSTENKSEEGIVPVESSNVAADSDKQVKFRSFPDDCILSDVSTEMIDEEKRDDVKLPSDEEREAADAVTDDKDDAAPGNTGSVPGKDEKVTLVVTDVWGLVEESEISGNRDATKLDEAAIQDATVVSNMPLQDEAVLSTSDNNVFESTPTPVITPFQADGANVSKEMDEVETDVLLSKSAEERHTGARTLPHGEEGELSVHQKVAALDDDGDDAILMHDLVTGKDDDTEGETAVRRVVKYIVDEVTSAKNDVSEIDHYSAALQSAVGAVEGSCEPTVESASLSEGSLSKVGSDDRAAASLISPEVDASVNDEKATTPECWLSSCPPVDDKKYVSDGDRAIELMEIEDQSPVQDNKISYVESDICSEPESVDENIEHADESACLPFADEIAASISDYLTGACVSDEMGGVLEMHDADDQGDAVSDKTHLLSSDAVCTEQEPSVVELMQHSDVSTELMDEEKLDDVILPSDEEREAADAVTDDKDDAAAGDIGSVPGKDEKVTLVVTDVWGLVEESEISDNRDATKLMLSDVEADRQSSETCDVDHSSSDQQAADMVEGHECLISVAEDESSKGSTLSYGSSGAVKESIDVGCAESFTPAGDDVQNECGSLSIEPESENVELSTYLSSSDQHDVPSVNDYDQVSESVEEAHGDDAEESLQPASEDVAPIAGDDDEDFEIDLL